MTPRSEPLSIGTERLRADYDATPYTSDAFPQSAPGRLAAIAHVFGLRTPDVPTARVLEIGCAAGGNVIPFAAFHPDAEVIGIDLSPVQIDRARSTATALALDNLEFIAADIAELDLSTLGRFDYVVAHGVYSWVPQEVRDALLASIRSVMSPDGVSYVSYNTHPGWKSKEVVRDAMLLASGASRTPVEKAADAREIVDVLRDVAPADGVLARVLAEFQSRDEDFGDAFLLHDELEAFNAPCYFYEMLGHARRHGLEFVAEARPEAMFATNHGAKVAEYVNRKAGGVQILVEQYLDFITNRAFRESLFTHAENASRIRYDLAPDRLRSLHLAAWSPPVGGATVLDHSRQEFVVGDGATLFTNDPGLKAALEALNDRWPWTLSRSELVTEVSRRLTDAGLTAGDRLGDHVDNLIGVLVVQGHAQYRLDALRPEPTVDAGLLLDEPIRRLAGLARPGSEDSLFNLWHETLLLSPMDRRAFPLLDGTRDRHALVRALRSDDGSDDDARSSADYVDALPDRLRQLKLA